MLNVTKIRALILMNGLTEEDAVKINGNIEHYLESGSAPLSEISKLVKILATTTENLMSPSKYTGLNARLTNGYEVKIDTEIMRKRTKELGWKESCLTEVVSEKKNLVRFTRYGQCKYLYDYELINLCYALECDLLYLQGKRRKPIEGVSALAPISGYYKLNSTVVLRQLKAIYDSNDAEFLTTKVKVCLGCSSKYATEVLFRGLSVSEVILSKLSKLTNTPGEDLVMKENIEDAIMTIENDPLQEELELVVDETHQEVKDAEIVKYIESPSLIELPERETVEEDQVKEESDTPLKKEKGAITLKANLVQNTNPTSLENIKIVPASCDEDIVQKGLSTSMELMNIILDNPEVIGILHTLQDIPAEKRHDILQFLRSGIVMLR